MPTTDLTFAGSIPALYDRYLGPLIFAGYAADLAARAAALRPTRVLETAAGTGIVTRALRAALPEAVEIVATDLNQPMLDHAAKVAPLAGVAWQQADALALPFADASFDVVACQFGAMFFPDKVAGYREARRVLRPGGTFLFNVWDRLEDSELPHEVSQAMGRHFQEDAPRFLERTPHGYFDRPRIEADVAAAGFHDVRMETVTHRSRATSARDAAIAFCQGTPLRNELERLAPGRLEELTDLAAAALAARFGAGPIEGKIQAIVVTAS